MPRKHPSAPDIIPRSSPPAPGLAGRQVAAVLEVGRAMVATADYEQMLTQVIEAVCDTVAATTGGFMRYDPATDELVLQKPAFGVHAPAVVDAYRVPLSAGGNAARVFLSREPYLANDAPGNPRMLQRFVALFRARNVLTVPLVLGEDTLGVFHAINKREGNFDQDDLAVLLLVAPLLASVLKTAQVVREVEVERRKQARTMHIHRALTRTASAARGIAPLASTLSELVQRPVAVIDRELRVIAGALRVRGQALRAGLAAITAPDAGVQRLRLEEAGEEPHEFSVVAIELGDETAGHLLVAEEGTPLDPIDLKAVEQAATVFAVKFLRERSAFEVERRTAGDALATLFSGEVTPREAMAMLRTLELPAQGPWRVLRFAAGREGKELLSPPNAQQRATLTEALRQLDIDVPLLPWQDGYVTLFTDAHWSRLTATDAEGLGAAQERMLRTPGPVWVGAGRVEARVSDLRWSLEGAERALLAAQRLGIRDRVVRDEELGVLRLLLSANPSEDHVAFVAQVLGPIRQADARVRKPVLMPTLETLVAEDFRLPQSARVLGIHLNTMKYRLRRLTDLLGGDPTRGERRLEIELALRLVQMRGGRLVERARQGARSGKSGSGRS